MEYSERIRKKIVSSDKSIIQTMKMMDDACTKLLLVFDGEKFKGMITNGDLQRSIISHTPFDTPIDRIISNKGKLFAKESDDRERIKEWMLAKRAELMPIINEKGDFLGRSLI